MPLSIITTIQQKRCYTILISLKFYTCTSKPERSFAIFCNTIDKLPALAEKLSFARAPLVSMSTSGELSISRSCNPSSSLLTDCGVSFTTLVVKAVGDISDSSTKPLFTLLITSNSIFQMLSIFDKSNDNIRDRRMKTLTL